MLKIYCSVKPAVQANACKKIFVEFMVVVTIILFKSFALYVLHVFIKLFTSQNWCTNDLICFTFFLIH